jgi:hypothetical protein
VVAVLAQLHEKAILTELCHQVGRRRQTHADVLLSLLLIFGKDRSCDDDMRVTDYSYSIRNKKSTISEHLGVQFERPLLLPFSERYVLFLTFI